ncbi:hypothetical protein Lal_00018774 [Lupinus albus]|nr:hypothetical protein Lal_00018774 [Lupinus albus]
MASESEVADTNILSSANCGKPAILQCPKCMELKLPREGSAFCTQECFKSSWSSHKSVKLSSSHGMGAPVQQNSDSLGEDWLFCLKGGQARTPKIPHFDWTGTLHQYPISSKQIVPAHINKPDWADDGIPTVELNSDFQRIVEVIKSPDLIERMRETCRIAREVLDATARIIQPGVTTDESDRFVHEATIAAALDLDSLDQSYKTMRKLKEMRISITSKLPFLFQILLHVGTFLLYIFNVSSNFSAFITVNSDLSNRSVNEVICHGIPDARKLEDGDIVNVDVTVYYKGVHGDLNETYFVGNVDEESRRLVKCTYECLEKAISIVKPGVRFREIGEIVNRHASMSGFSVVCGDRMWPDGWTAVTADIVIIISAQFEHTLLVSAFFPS